MQINLFLTGKLKLLLGGVVVVLLVVFVWQFLSRGGASPEEQRLAHLEYLVRALETYREQYGFYPQPTAREETAEGFRHIWGYRPELPALASCTVASGKDDAPDLFHSVCGGNIYDRERRVMGWKGTLTVRSAQNSVEVAMKGGGRLAVPFSEITRQVPLDPSYATQTALAQVGFGEYVYAVRAHADGALGKGGVEYQLAATVRDSTTGRLRTVIRGNYFVRSADRDVMPPSLIGPGLVLDRFGNPLPDQEHPFHVLLDSQQEGYPNPLLGEGERVLRFLTLRIRAKRLLQAAISREEIVRTFFPSEAATALGLTLKTLQSTLEPLVEELQDSRRMASEVREGQPVSGSGELDLDVLEATVQELSQRLAEATTLFLTAKVEEVGTVLRAEAEQRGAMVKILSGTFLRAEQAQEFVLLARDELIRYLDGEGIEDQSRNRAERKVASAIESIPNLPALFSEQRLPFPHPFLPSDVQRKVDDLGVLEGGERMQTAPAQATGSLLSGERSEKVSTGVTTLMERPRTGTGSAGDGMPASSVMVTTLTSEMTQLFAELKSILQGIEEDFESPARSVEEIDDALRRLSRALGAEIERLEMMFAHLANEGVAQQLLARHEALLTVGDRVEAIRLAAESAGLQGDFTPFLFSPRLLGAVVFERKPGIPDTFAYGNPLEAEYKGIPYPLP